MGGVHIPSGARHEPMDPEPGTLVAKSFHYPTIPLMHSALVIDMSYPASPSLAERVASY